MGKKSFPLGFCLQVVQEALKPENRNSISYIAQKYGIHENTINIWIKNYNLYGEEGLKPYTKSRLRINV